MNDPKTLPIILETFGDLEKLKVHEFREGRPVVLVYGKEERKIMIGSFVSLDEANQMATWDAVCSARERQFYTVVVTERLI